MNPFSTLRMRGLSLVDLKTSKAQVVGLVSFPRGRFSLNACIIRIVSLLSPVSTLLTFPHHSTIIVSFSLLRISGTVVLTQVARAATISRSDRPRFQPVWIGMYRHSTGQYVLLVIQYGTDGYCSARYVMVCTHGIMGWYNYWAFLAWSQHK